MKALTAFLTVILVSSLAQAIPDYKFTCRSFFRLDSEEQTIEQRIQSADEDIAILIGQVPVGGGPLKSLFSKSVRAENATKKSLEWQMAQIEVLRISYIQVLGLVQKARAAFDLKIADENRFIERAQVPKGPLKAMETLTERSRSTGSSSDDTFYTLAMYYMLWGPLFTHSQSTAYIGWVDHTVETGNTTPSVLEDAQQKLSSTVEDYKSYAQSENQAQDSSAPTQPSEDTFKDMVASDPVLNDVKDVAAESSPEGSVSFDNVADQSVGEPPSVGDINVSSTDSSWSGDSTSDNNSVGSFNDTPSVDTSSSQSDWGSSSTTSDFSSSTSDFGSSGGSDFGGGGGSDF